MHSRIESLEERRLLSESSSPFGVTTRGTLVVQGTAGNDEIVVRDSGGVVTVSMNALREFQFSGVSRIRIEGASGGDVISFSGDSRIPVRVLGGNGNDRITGVGKRVTLSGGTGNDDLFGAGDDGITFVGGHGGDRVFGTAGPDSLFGGSGDDFAAVLTFADADEDVERVQRVA